MNDEAPYKLFRGRPPKDEVWGELVSKSHHVIDNDENEDGVLRETVRLDGQLPRGCTNFGGDGEKYYCVFFIGGVQRHIAKGTLYQCAKFYDYALLYFDKYRVRKAVTSFNFDKVDDESEMVLDLQIGEYFLKLENHLLQSGALTLPTLKKKEKRGYKRTIAGTIEKWMEELQPYIFEIADAQDEIKARLTAIESHLKIP